MSALNETVTLTIVETVHYGAEFTIAELNELCVKHGIAPHDPEGETGDLVAWLQDEASEAIQAEDGLLERIEHRSGDIQGQDWKWTP